MRAEAGAAAWRRLIVPAVVVAVGVALVRGCAARDAKPGAEAMRRVTAGRQDLRVTKTATGEVTPQNRVEVKPPIAGRIEQVLVREGDTVTQGQVLVWMSSAERAALLDAARSQGPEALARWETVYKAAPLVAPLDGTLIARKVEPGQTVGTDDPVVVVADRLIVEAQVDETDIGDIQVGQPAMITVDAYPRDAVAAHVDHVAYEAETVNNVTVYHVDVLPAAVPDFMRSGMTATVTFTVAASDDALVVPADAVQRDGGEAAVLVPGGAAWGNTPERRTVQTGITDGKWVEITSGLQDGDAVLAPSLNLPRAPRAPRSSPLTPGRRRQPSGGQPRPQP